MHLFSTKSTEFHVCVGVQCYKSTHGFQKYFKIFAKLPSQKISLKLKNLAQIYTSLDLATCITEKYIQNVNVWRQTDNEIHFSFNSFSPQLLCCIEEEHFLVFPIWAAYGSVARKANFLNTIFALWKS